MSEELKLCPFCGAEPFMQEIEPHTHSAPLKALGIQDHPGSWTVECPTDGCCGMIDIARESVVAHWNRRSPYELPEEQVEEIAEPQDQREPAAWLDPDAGKAITAAEKEAADTRHARWQHSYTVPLYR